MALDFKSHMFQAMAQVPSYSRWLLDADLATTYAYERRVLKLLQWGFPERPWRLKCPTHFIFLEQLNGAFPDARFVMTHRDPLEVIPSVIAVYADIVGNFTDKIDLQYLAELPLEHWSVGMQRTLAFRDVDENNARFYDIDFWSMHKDPIGEVRGLYEWLGEPIGQQFEEGMTHWWQHNCGNREPTASRNPLDYGVDPDRIRSVFTSYNSCRKRWTANNRHENGRGR